MRQQGFENAIPLEICKQIKDFFDDNPDLHINKSNNPNVTKINKPWSHLHEILNPILSQYFETRNGQGGNIYKHTNTYTIHTDSSDQQQLINCCIPIHLEVTQPQQKFIVFDQYTDNGFGRTWYGDRDTSTNGDFDSNKKISTIPYNDPIVHACTDSPIDKDFFDLHLNHSHCKYEYFHGLTGTVYDFKPGNMIVFNSNNIHSTGKLVGPWKMGLLIQFEGTLEELLHE